MNIFSIRSLLILILGLAFVQERSYGEECFEEIIDCLDENEFNEFFGQRISLRHAEGSGLGYAIGYTSLDLFLSKSFDGQSFVPFLDLRGHIFNNGKYAANAALGFRYFNCCLKQIWGINVAYDYLQHLQQYPHRSYHQIGGGLEIIGEMWDFHLNAYVPVGHKKTNIYRFSYGFYEELERGNLSSLNLGLKAAEQLALNGIDMLFGYRFFKICDTDLHISAGPYYYWGRTEKTTNAFTGKNESTFGGRLELDMLCMKYFSIGANVSYDHIFKWRSQGMISVNIPLDIFQNWCSDAPCSLRDRLYDRMERNEIIAIDCLNRLTNDPRVLDPEFQP